MKSEIMNLNDLNLKYARAPYNFIPFPSKSVNRYNSFDDLPKHNTYLDKNKNTLLSGTIEYEIVAKTPIIVSEGESSSKIKMFFKNTRGDYAIPANSIRGVLRKNTQILSMSSPVNENKELNKNLYDIENISDIENRRLLYRDIASNNSLTEIYKKRLAINTVKRIAENVRSGYIIRDDNSDYLIYESEKLFNNTGYTRINEKKLKQIVDKSIKDKINFMYNENKRVNSRYKPYFLEVSFDFDEKRSPIRISEKGKLSKEGILLSGGFIPDKSAHYLVVAPVNDINPFKISKTDVFNYIKDCKRTKKKDPFYYLPEKGTLKHVFYIEKDGHFHFGFTPYMRIFYKNDILTGIKDPVRYVNGISYEKSLYGFSEFYLNEKKYDYKSRLSFEDAVLTEGKECDESFLVILGEPKPTSYTLYLKQNSETDKKNLITYEDDDFELRGYKDYWLKNYIENLKVDTEKGNDKVNSFLKPLEEGSRFKGKIHFKNLNKDELGLLLWSLMLNKNSYQSFGMGKPYGFGRVKIENVKLKLEDLDRKYGDFSFDYHVDADPSYYIEEYKKYFSEKYLKGKDIEEDASIKTFLYMKEYVVDKNDRDYYSYMPLVEFKNKKILPEALSYKEKIKTKINANNSSNQDDNQKDKDNNNQKNKSKKSKRNNDFGNKIDLSDFKL
ncbi:TIGR03986 family CRISPR-associated RAMP protein [Soehngenia longivitae]|uniref:TIGR03986 family CRISPR-associated RAMP protein n=1 Tax=Soehngenia longivitae TaxID=2562294 RepID=A0A4Z0D219_9FIRM|nr:TIGR03986 family CRISPR-associated RAMP protein [Soehngenia longivitae]TFZ39375.1 TIGR03986 family CRISPR-associated RAMP protein [Soehngenia longivitae]